MSNIVLWWKYDRTRTGQGGAESGGAVDHRTAALAEHETVREGPADFLLEGQEEAWSEGEGAEPQSLEGGLLVVVAYCLLDDPQKCVSADARNDESGTDGERALGERVALGGSGRAGGQGAEGNRANGTAGGAGGTG
jgi:hypothetical protein